MKIWCFLGFFEDVIDGKVDHRGQTFEYEKRENNKKRFVYRVCFEESISSSGYHGHESNQEEKRENKEDDFPKFSFGQDETFVDIGFGFFNSLTIEEFKIRKSETDRETDEPDEESDGYDERNGSYDEIGESELHSSEDSHSDHQYEKYDYRTEEVE